MKLTFAGSVADTSILGHHQTSKFTWLGVPKESLSGLEKFEAPDPAEWCPRGYVMVQPDARGSYHSEGNLYNFGTQVSVDVHSNISVFSSADEATIGRS